MNRLYISLFSLLLHASAHSMVKDHASELFYKEKVAEIVNKPITTQSFEPIIKEQIKRSCAQLVLQAESNNLYIDQNIVSNYYKSVHRCQTNILDAALVARYGLAKIYEDFDIEESLASRHILNLANTLYSDISNDPSLQIMLTYALNKGTSTCGNPMCLMNKLCLACSVDLAPEIWSDYHLAYRARLQKKLEADGCPLQFSDNIRWYLWYNKDINCVTWSPLIQAATLVLFYSHQIERNIRFAQ